MNHSAQNEVYPLDRKPPWLRARVPGGGSCSRVRELIQDGGLNTVCQSAHCPNIGECWNRGTATMMILGNVCTRNCHFCAVETGKPGKPDADEPRRVAEAVAQMNLKYVVLTSVTRDDLEDGGAEIWAQTIREVRAQNPGVLIEVLIPDFQGDEEALKCVLSARPDVLNHNLETVPRLYPAVRPQAVYQRSLELLQRAKEAGFVAKTGLMLGLGEEANEIESVLGDLRSIHVDVLTLGQYLQPSQAHLPVARWVSPEEFGAWKTRGLVMGFRMVESAPLVRSSYHADAVKDYLEP